VTGDVSGTSIEGLRTIAGGSFAIRRISTHIADFSHVKQEMKEVLHGDDFFLIETDALSAQNKKEGYPFELEMAL
jgi:hypothetical protein